MRTSLVALVALLLALPVRADENEDKAAIRKTTSQLLAAYARKDLDGVRACWSEASPERDAFQKWARAALAGKDGLKIQEPLQYSRWQVEADKAGFRLRFIQNWQDAATKQARRRVVYWNIRCVRAAGGWKWSHQSEAMADLAVVLGRAATEAERSRLLMEEKELVGPNLSATLRGEGMRAADQRRFAEALGYHDAALQVAESLGHRRELGWCHDLRGHIFERQGQRTEALEQYQEALAIFRQIKDRGSEADALGHVATIYRAGRKTAEALAQYQARREILHALGDRRAEAAALMDVAYTYAALHQHAEALAADQESLELFRALRDKAGEANCLYNLGNTYSALRKYADARAAYESGLEIWKALGDRAGQARASNNLGTLHNSLGRYPEAAARYESALELYRALGDQAGEARARHNLGTLYQATGRYSEAQNQLETSLRIKRAAGDRAGEASTLNQLGQLRFDRGQFGEALTYCENSLKLTREAGNRAGEALVQGNLGQIYQTLGRDQEAAAHYDAQLRILRELGDQAGAVKAGMSLGSLHKKAGRYAEARAAFEAGLKTAREQGNRVDEAQALGDLGTVYRAMGKYAEAQAQSEASLTLARQLGRPSMEVTALTNLANDLLAQGKPVEATAQLQAALALTDALGDVDGALACQFNLGLIYRSQRRWPDAIEAFRAAVRCLEQLRSQIKEASLQTSFFERYAACYGYLALCQLELRQWADAFATTERAKARTLVELFQAGKAEPVKALTDAERRRETELAGSVNALSIQCDGLRSRPGADRKELEALTHQLEKARAELDSFHRQLFALHPHLQAQRARFEPLALTALNHELFAQEPDVGVLSYLVTDSELLLFVLTRGKDASAPAHLTIKHILVKQKELAAAVAAFREACSRSGSEVDGRKLYRTLLKPAEQELAGKRHVVILPDDVLHTLPFQALQDAEGKYLIERCAVSYAPSVTALVKMRELAAQRRKEENKPARALLALGRPVFPASLKDLPATEDEVEGLGDLFGKQALVLTSKSASKARALAELGSARYVHLATHGLVNEAMPLYSAVVLTKGPNDDGLLYARELLDLDLRAELVVLSACETALGQRVRGEGILGLTWALFVAGTPSSVVSQWSVNDRSTRQLMTAFYQGLVGKKAKEAGLDKAEALRQAQLGLLRSAKYQHPAYWAPFILVGDWCP